VSIGLLTRASMVAALVMDINDGVARQQGGKERHNNQLKGMVQKMAFNCSGIDRWFLTAVVMGDNKEKTTINQQMIVQSILLSRKTKTKSGASSVSGSNMLDKTLCLKIMSLV
jgi:hypothetical protein